MLCDMYHPHTSGVTNHISLVKGALEAAGHEVYVLTFGDRDHADTEPNVVRSFGVPWGNTGYNAWWRYSAEARRIAASLDVAHVHHPFQSGRMALRYCAPLGIPVAFTSHTRYDVYARVYAGYLPAAVTDAFVRGQLRSFCRRTSLVVAPSQATREFLLRMGVDAPIDVIRNGIDPVPFRDAAPEPRERLGLAADDIALVYLGRLGAEKSLGTLVDAFAEAHRTQPRLALVLVGDGPEREALAGRAAELGVAGRVRFLGTRSYETVPPVLAACDGFVTASTSEVDPLTVMESMAAGLPVVAVDAPPLPESVEDGVSGLLVPAEALGGALARFAGDEGLRASLSRGALAASARFDVKNTAAALLCRYDRLTTR